MICLMTNKEGKVSMRICTMHSRIKGSTDTGQSGSADPFMSQPLITSFMSETNWGPVADMPWIDEGLAAPYDQGDLPNSTSLDSFIQDYNWTIPSGSSDVQFNQTQASGFPIDPLTAQLKVSDEPMPDSPPLMFGIKPPDPQINTFTVGSEEVSKSSSIMDLASQPKDTTAKGGELVSERSVAESDVHHRRMQELSELGMDLYSQVIANEEYHKAQLAKSSVTPCEELVGNILKSSATFLKLLGSFYSPTTIKRSTSKASVFDSSDGEISPSEASNLSDFSDFATSTSAVTTAGIRSQDHQWKRSSLNPSLSRSSLDGNNDDGSTKPLTADMTTILQLLTCYIRIIHLHNIFYTQVHDCLTAPPDKREKPIPPIFPGMHVGGLSLDEFPNFQIKLLLQISTHMLGEIEKALGLPDGYRISKKSGQSQGILEASVSVQFVEMTMRENVRTGLMGIEKDRVKSIRDKLGSLRNLLKGTINI